MHDNNVFDAGTGISSVTVMYSVVCSDFFTIWVFLVPRLKVVSFNEQGQTTFETSTGMRSLLLGKDEVQYRHHYTTVQYYQLVIDLIY